MNITEVTVTLMPYQAGSKFVACACFIIDGAIAVHDVKIIKHESRLIVAMPSKKITYPCPSCKGKNYLRAAYCSQCGVKLVAPSISRTEQGREKVYVDIVHPISRDTREQINQAILVEYQRQKDLALSASPSL